ncbi:unnamed protein product [Sphagnum jensenii]|uniref:Uncharacterized protein n=1 Tax=Sphagnum jensenii TaxID=128206 RepID=A0ABP0VFE2_9BRYO
MMAMALAFPQIAVVPQVPQFINSALAPTYVSGSSAVGPTSVFVSPQGGAIPAVVPGAVQLFPTTGQVIAATGQVIPAPVAAIVANPTGVVSVPIAGSYGGAGMVSGPIYANAG